MSSQETRFGEARIIPNTAHDVRVGHSEPINYTALQLATVATSESLEVTRGICLKADQCGAFKFELAVGDIDSERPGVTYLSAVRCTTSECPIQG